MENKIYHVSNKEISSIQNLLKLNELLYIAELDGQEIQNVSNYLSAVTEIFKFPIPAKTLDGYLDWIRDLSWLNAQGYVLIIRNFELFMKQNLKAKQDITDDFMEIILPWWQGEVENCVVEGKAKPFMVYLVD